MKKSIFLAALTLVTGMALTGCKDDTQPRLQAPTGPFELFEPANNNFTYDLTNSNAVIMLTTSGQPDFGVATPTSYEVQISLDNTWEEGVIDPATGEYGVYPTYYSLSTVNTQSIIEASALELNQGITYLQGIHDEGQEGIYNSDPCPLWVRIRAYVADPGAENGYVPYSVYYSNVIKLNSVQPSASPSLPLPGKVYVIGDYQGWNIDGGGDTATLTEAENGIGSNIYTGYIYMTTGQAANGFKIYTVLGDWGSDGSANSYGASVADQNNPIDLDEDVYKGPAVKGGKGNWNISNLPADGYIRLELDANAMTVEFTYDPDYTE